MKKIALCLFFTTFFALPAQAFTVKHDFKVILGPFDASQTSFTYALEPDSYQVNSTVRTSGVLDTLYPFKANYATAGRITKSGLETSSYHYDSKSRFSKRSKELIYNDQGQPIYRLSSKNGKSKKVDILPDAAHNDTTDLQTVFAELARQYNRVKFCDSRLQVFDGKRRFDVIFKDEGHEKIAANEHTTLSGDAVKCSMYIDKLGAQGDDLLWELTQDRPIYFWLLDDPQTKKPYIARVHIEETPLGKLDVYTTQITVKD